MTVVTTTCAVMLKYGCAFAMFVCVSYNFGHCICCADLSILDSSGFLAVQRAMLIWQVMITQLLIPSDMTKETEIDMKRQDIIQCVMVRYAIT